MMSKGFVVSAFLGAVSAQVASITVNVNSAAGATPLTATDFPLFAT